MLASLSVASVPSVTFGYLPAAAGDSTNQV